ncbi:hypothetical protein DFP72DRAFT_1043824 [Ephemerocybe angulata]|uniref:Uncharacterized protein n=1 Tax=Ephemerocybe angulata TaxID=980116 RepID=A0A8H6I3Y5_9AGAR|nr:hypothetical protein DFP72DRAFT_1043824 [Tulosesus angulatus]
MKRTSTFSFQSKGGGVIVLEDDGPPGSQVRARTICYRQGVLSGTSFNYTSGDAVASGQSVPRRAGTSRADGTASSVALERDPRGSTDTLNYHPICIGLACNFSFLEPIEKIFNRIKGLLNGIHRIIQIPVPLQCDEHGKPSQNTKTSLVERGRLTHGNGRAELASDNSVNQLMGSVSSSSNHVDSTIATLMQGHRNHFKFSSAPFCAYGNERGRRTTLGVPERRTTPNHLYLLTGGSFEIEIASNRGKTELSSGSRDTSEWPDDESYAQDYDQSKAAGTVFAVSRHSDINQVTPENLVVFSVRYNTPWKRVIYYDVPASLPSCPPDGCICAWGWVPYGSKSTVPVKVLARAPVWCEGNEGACVGGAKQMIYWNQKEGNNVEVEGRDRRGEFKSPGYNMGMGMGFRDGARNDIFGGSAPAPASSSSSSSSAAGGSKPTSTQGAKANNSPTSTAAGSSSSSSSTSGSPNSLTGSSSSSDTSPAETPNPISEKAQRPQSCQRKRRRAAAERREMEYCYPLVLGGWAVWREVVLWMRVHDSQSNALTQSHRRVYGTAPAGPTSGVPVVGGIDRFTAAIDIPPLEGLLSML